MIRLGVCASRLGFGLWLCLSVVGCESKPYALAPVSGKVTLDGRPVPGSLVKFTPITVGEKTPGPVSTGRCDEDGQYSLTTTEGDRGAVVGQHRVSIFSFSPEVAPGPDEPPERELFPSRFNTATMLTSDVTEAGLENEDFELATRRR